MSVFTTRCDRSFPLVHPELVQSRLLPERADSSAPGLPAELREISPSSAKLLVAGPPELPSRCRLQLLSSKLMRTMELPGEIGWARPNPAGDWLVECEFLTRLSDSQFSELTSSGLLERRSAVRFQTRINVDVLWQPESGRLPGIVRDLSEGGLCLMTCQPPIQSRDLHVIARVSSDEVRIRLKTRWSLSVGENHLVGCQFINGRDFHLLRMLQPATNEQFTEYSRGGKPLQDRT
jgi:hypothetical protein